MPTPPTNANPSINLLVPGYDSSGHQVNVAVRVTNIATDATTGIVYGELVTSPSAASTYNNASVGTDGSAIPTSSTLIGASDGTNLQQLLVESASNRNLRIAIYNAANELGIDSNGVIKALLQVVSGTALAADQSNTVLRISNYVKTASAGDTALALGQATKVNSLPVTVASDQGTLGNVGSSTATGSAVPANAFLLGLNNSGNLSGWNSLNGVNDAISGSSVAAQGGWYYTGSTWDRIRTPNIFKTATATASGDTALWTPTSGKKFRLMSFLLTITADAAQAVSGDIDIVLRDATTPLGLGLSVFVPSVAMTTFGNNVSTGWITLGNGPLSSTANNVLNINLSAALTGGKVRAIACGTEE